MKQLNFTQDQYVKMRQSGMTPQQIEQLSSQTSQPAVKDFLTTASDIVGKIFPGKQTGEAIGTLGGLAYTKAKDVLQGTDVAQNYDVSAPLPLQVGGDVLKGAATIAGLKAPLPSSALKGAAGIASRTAQSAGMFGAIGGAQALGQSLTEQQGAKDTISNVGKAAGTSAVLGTVFNLLGEGISAAAKKVGPSALEFTSGVPKSAIQQAAENPNVAKQGLKMNVNEVRTQAESALNSLQSDLNNELNNGLTVVSQTAQIPPNVHQIPNKILENVQGFTDKLGIGLKKSAKGVSTDFAKSAIVQPGEQKAVQTALDTVNSWTDFSPDGMVKLSQRIGALKDFDSSGITRSSAIVGKIYGAVNKEIANTYPEVSKLRTNYANNQEVLDTISQVLNASKDKIGSQQAAVTKLDNIFKENRDLYINAIKELSQRSGTDILSLLAGGEFQKLLPGYVRGIGGAATVGVASYFNPWAILLAPLFSPRGAGVIARNANAIGKTTSTLVRAATTKAVGNIASQK